MMDKWRRSKVEESVQERPYKAVHLVRMEQPQGEVSRPRSYQSESNLAKVTFTFGCGSA